MKVYIAGPMTGYDNYNRDAFAAKARELRQQGYEVFSPAELDDEDEKFQELEAAGEYPLLWHYCMKRDLALLLTCDAIHMLPGWEDSVGASTEMNVAVAAGMWILNTGSQVLTAETDEAPYRKVWEGVGLEASASR